VFMESEGKRRLVRITVWVAVLGMLLGVLASIITATSAEAHAALRSTSPRDGSTVTSAPATVVLEFNERIGASFVTVTVTGPGGAPVSDGRPQVDGDTVTQPLAASLPDGGYAVAFRVVSEDGHAVSGRTRFTVQSGGTQPTSPSTSSTASPSPATTVPTTRLPSVTETAATATPAADDGTPLRVGLAVGVAALALAAGTAFVALTRRRPPEQGPD
jgi:copper resistance protein C